MTEEEWNSPQEEERRRARWQSQQQRRRFEKSQAKARGVTHEEWIAHKAALAEARRANPTDRAIYQRERLKLAPVQKWLQASQKKSRAKRLALIQSFKRAPCCDCGGLFHPQAMEFDHPPGEKSFSISTYGRRVGVDLLKREIAKCDLVCANCHRVRTARRREGLPATLPPPEYEI